MTPSEYQDLSRRTARAEMPKLTEQETRMINWALGLGEVGELQNLVKKWLFHGHNQTRLEMAD